MDIPATPPSSAGLIDRLAETAEALQRSLDENGAGLGEVLFVLFAVHILMRFASLYLRLKAGLLAPLRSEAAASPRGRAATPATTRAGSRVTPAGLASGTQNVSGAHAPEFGDAADVGDPAYVGDAANVDGAFGIVVVVPRSSRRAPTHRTRPGVSPRRPDADGAHLVMRARSRPPGFSTGLGAISFARP